jgi:hypothetical protein
MDITKTKQWKDVGGLSKPGKMPCYSYSLPAKRCIAGRILFNLKDSVCEKCYARRGRYPFRNVQNALERRFQSIVDPSWVDNMTFLIKAAGQSYFRWHDSGDIQGQWHLNNIVEIAKKCPDVSFWLPTKEFRMVADWKAKHGDFPENLCVRLSAPFKEYRVHHAFGPSSMVVKDPTKNNNPFTLCGSFKNKGKCGTCRSCWDRKIILVAYKEH